MGTAHTRTIFQLCVFMCSCKQILWGIIFGHSSHWNNFSPVCLHVQLQTKIWGIIFGHSSHWNNFYLFVFMCSCKRHFWGHPWGRTHTGTTFSPVWHLVKLQTKFLGTFFGQSSHWNNFFPCVASCEATNKNFGDILWAELTLE